MSALAANSSALNSEDFCSINGYTGDPLRVPFHEMNVLHQRGFHLIPCGGLDGKRPLLRKWNDHGRRRLPVEICLGVMEKHNSSTYGIRLDGLAVVDCDTWNDETRKFVLNSFPRTLFEVVTSRGKHLYFKKRRIHAQINQIRRSSD